MAYETLLYDVRDGIATLTLNRPERLNAVTPTSIRELVAAIDAADNDNAVKVLVFTGAGRAYCAGADLGSGGSAFSHDELAPDGGGLVTLRLFDCNKPVIAAINGAAVGFGATMTLAMDARLASEEARFGFVFARRGIVPEACSSWFLPRLVGIAQALDWTYSGRIFPASEALEKGLVSRVLPKGDLLPAAYALAAEYRDNCSSVSLALIRQMMWKMQGADHPMEAHRLDSRGVYFTGKTADSKEGVEAFLEKRQARFPGQVPRDLPGFLPWWDPKRFR